jgi:hypothetical protein
MRDISAKTQVISQVTFLIIETVNCPKRYTIHDSLASEGRLDMQGTKRQKSETSEAHKKLRQIRTVWNQLIGKIPRSPEYEDLMTQISVLVREYKVLTESPSGFKLYK